MPYMKVSTTERFSDEMRTKLLDGLQNALWLIPEKKGFPVIFDLEEGKTFYVNNKKQEQWIHVDVSYFSRFKYNKRKEFTETAFDVMHEITGIDKEKIYLLINERETWGGHGGYLDEFVTEF